MKVYENGEYRDMTESEIRECEEIAKNIKPEEATIEERIEAQVTYTAMMTDTLLEVN